MNAILHTQSTWRGCEFKVHQFHVKNEVQTLRTESSVDFESNSGSIGVYLQHIFSKFSHGYYGRVERLLET